MIQCLYSKSLELKVNVHFCKYEMSILKENPIIPFYEHQNEMKDRMRCAELFYQMKRQTQILFIFKQLSLLKNNDEGVNNLKLPLMNLAQWKKIFKMTLNLAPIISKIKQYKEFQLWLFLIRGQKAIQIKFIRLLRFRKEIILRSRLKCWCRVLSLKRYYDSIPVFSDEDLKLRAYRAFVIIRLRKKRDIKNTNSLQKVRNCVLIEKVFNLWKKKSKLIRLFNYYRKKYLFNVLKCVFVTWIKYKRIHVRLRHLFDTLIEFEHQNSAYKVFKKWQSKFFDIKILCKKSSQLIQSTIKMRTRRIFRRWKSSINYIQQMNEAKVFIESKSSSFSVKKCFLIWKNKYQINFNHKQLLKKQIFSYIAFIQRIYFQKFQIKLKEIIDKREKIQRFHSKLLNGKLKKALFSYWKIRYNKRRIARIKWIKATNKWHSTLLKNFFKNWHFEAKSTKKYSHHLIQISFLSFRKYHQYVIRTKYVLLTTYKLYNFYLKQNMLKRWSKIVNQKKEMFRCQKHFRICVLLDSFVVGSSNFIQKRKYLSVGKHNQMNVQPIFTNDDEITELTNELKKIQKQIALNPNDSQMNKKYLQIIKRINQLQQSQNCS